MEGSKLPKMRSHTSRRLRLGETFEEAKAHAQRTLRAYRLSTAIPAATRMLGMKPTTGRLDRRDGRHGLGSGNTPGKEV